jgi:hypothetical protein
MNNHYAIPNQSTEAVTGYQQQLEDAEAVQTLQ